MDPRLKYAQWHKLGNVYTYRMPWSEKIWESIADLQKTGVVCPTCLSAKGHAPSCKIWVDVADYENRPANVGDPGVEAVELSPETKEAIRLVPTEEQLTLWAEGRFSVADKNLLSKDADVIDIIRHIVVSEAVAEDCRNELRLAAKRGWKRTEE